MIDYDTRVAAERPCQGERAVTTVAPEGLIDCPMLQTVSGRPTDYWNDSCAIDELRYAVARGATGATSNPSIVLEVLSKERAYWTARILELARESPSLTESDLTWAVVEEMAVRGAAILEPVFVREGGRKGRLSIQTNPANYPNTANDARTGAPVRGPRSEHAGEVPGHPSGHRRDRGGDRRRDQRQRDGLLHRAPGDRRGRRDRARPRRVRGRVAATCRTSRPCARS